MRSQLSNKQEFDKEGVAIVGWGNCASRACLGESWKEEAIKCGILVHWVPDVDAALMEQGELWLNSGALSPHHQRSILVISADRDFSPLLTLATQMDVQNAVGRFHGADSLLGSAAQQGSFLLESSALRGSRGPRKDPAAIQIKIVRSWRPSNTREIQSVLQEQNMSLGQVSRLEINNGWNEKLPYRLRKMANKEAMLRKAIKEGYLKLPGMEERKVEVIVTNPTCNASHILSALAKAEMTPLDIKELPMNKGWMRTLTDGQRKRACKESVILKAILKGRLQLPKCVLVLLPFPIPGER